MRFSVTDWTLITRSVRDVYGLYGDGIIYIFFLVVNSLRTCHICTSIFFFSLPTTFHRMVADGSVWPGFSVIDFPLA